MDTCDINGSLKLTEALLNLVSVMVSVDDNALDPELNQKFHMPGQQTPAADVDKDLGHGGTENS